MMPSLRPARGVLALGSLLVVYAAGCGALLGLDDFEDQPSTASTGTGGGAASGGAGGSGAGAATGGTGGTGGSETCAPDETEACYGGPAGTETKGICKAGTRSCTPEGVFGACQGQVVPADETCAEPKDEDCSGFDCARWSAIHGESGIQYPSAAAFAPNGDIYLGGDFFGSVSFGGDTLVSANGDVFLAKLDGAGKEIWTKQIGPAGDQGLVRLATGPGGQIAASGMFKNNIDIDGTTFTSTDLDGWVAVFGPAGALVWAKHLAGNAIQFGGALAFLGNGDLIVGGVLHETLELDGQVLATTGGLDGFVVRLAAASGDVVWIKQFGTAGGDEVSAVAVDVSDNILLTGSFEGGPLKFPPVAPITAAGGPDIFVAKLDPQGQAVWARPFGDAGFQLGRDLAVGPAGEAFVSGAFDGSVSFGGAAGTLTAEPAGTEAFLLKMSSAGQAVWAKQVGGNGANVGFGGYLAAHADGSVVAAIDFDGTLDMQPASITSDGPDLLLVGLRPDGGVRWTRHVGGPGAQSATLAAGFEDDTLVAGGTSEPIDLGTGLLSGKANGNVWVARYAP